MSIVQLSKVTFIGLSADKSRLFVDLQKIGCVQLINLTPDDNETAEIKSTAGAGAREALQFIQSYPYHRRQERNEQRFDATEIEQKILAVRTNLHNLKDERDSLLKRLQDVRPWGYFSFPSLTYMGQLRFWFWFYVVKHKDLTKITDVVTTWEIVQQDQRFCYVVVIAKHEIEEISVPRVHLGDRSRHELEERLHDVELAIEDTEAADKYGFFLPRGVTIPALNIEKKWRFTASVKVGDKVLAGGVVGTVPEGEFQHKLMIPFNEPEAVEITWINKEGDFTIDTVIARYNSSKGRDIKMTMQQNWAIRKPIPEAMLRRRFAERLYPIEPITTTTRIIDTFFPIARGGTACIPGPFGAGKTVLQSLIARYSTVDIAIIVACGERAGEVVETITEYPETKDPRTGGTLMDRTIIICNILILKLASFSIKTL
jgi:hypothetical protein